MTQKQQIADSFERLTAERGYAKATLDDVARDLRISKKTIYVHFDGKREIYEHVVAQRAEKERLRMKAELSALPTYRDRVEALVRFVLAAGRAHFAETGRDEWLEEYEVAADAFRRAHGDLLREILEDGQVAGEFAEGDAMLVQRMVAAMAGDYLIAVNADPCYDRDDELVERILRFIG